MTTTHSFQLRGTWTGNKLSVGRLESDTLATSLSVPSALGGPGVGTNPEHLLLSAAAGCYLITLASILTNRHIPYQRIDLETEGFVVDDRGLRIDKMVHRPTIVLDEPSDEQQLFTLAQHAEHACMVSSAMRGNVEVMVEPRVTVQSATR